MAGHRGIEPLLLDLESNVLPLTLMTCGASEEARTLDLLLGKQTFYQLNYTRIGSPSWTRTSDKVINSHPLYQLSYRGLWWSWQGSNLLPLPCKGSALPDELQPRGATDWNRTNDLKFTKLLLYHLSYSSIKGGRSENSKWILKLSRFKQGSNVKKQIWYLMSFSVCKKGERPNKKQIFFF